MAVLFIIGGNIDVQAQGNKSNKKYWKQVEKAEKQRSKYIRKQNKEDDKYYRKYQVRRNGPPPWAKAHGYKAKHHIYFTDYRTFYDPYRGGYVYLNGGTWGFSVNLPSFLINVDLGRARTRIISNIPITRHPEDFYYDYNEGYW